MTVTTDLTLRFGDFLTIGGGLVMAGAFLAFVRSALGRQDEKIADLLVSRDKHDHRIRNTEQGQIAVVTEIKVMAELLREVRDAVLRSRP